MQSKPQNNSFSDLKGLTALVVEDNQLNALVVQRLLSKWGINSELAINGKIAIDIVENTQFDFILMDLHLPEMDGFDATEYIRTHKNVNMKTPIFALTIDMTAADKIGYSILFDGFLQKPLQIEILYEALMGNEKIPVLGSKIKRIQMKSEIVNSLNAQKS